jgi:hypothetical protein
MVFGLRMRGCLQGQRCGVHFRGVHSARELRAIAALPRTCILIAACGGAVSSREGKEPRTTPGGAGDGAGDGGQLPRVTFSREMINERRPVFDPQLLALHQVRKVAVFFEMSDRLGNDGGELSSDWANKFRPFPLGRPPSRLLQCVQRCGRYRLET